MILDLQNYLSNPASGDNLAGADTDIVGGQVIDQQVKNGLFSGPGGAHVAPFVFSKLDVALAGATSVQAVVQDSPDNVTYTDRILGDVVLLASAVVNAELMKRRLNRGMARYIRIVYRIVGTASAGTAISALVLDPDHEDLMDRKPGTTVSKPTGAADMSVANGVLEG